MPNCMDRLDASETNEDRDLKREWMCVLAVVSVGSFLGCLFVVVREALGLKM